MARRPAPAGTLASPKTCRHPRLGDIRAGQPGSLAGGGKVRPRERSLAPCARSGRAAFRLSPSTSPAGARRERAMELEQEMRAESELTSHTGERTKVDLGDDAVPQTTMQVRKRTGASEPVDVNKIVRAVERWVADLDEIDPLRVATKTISGLYDGATTAKLDRLSIQTAAVLPGGLPTRRARLDLRAVPPGGEAVEVLRRHRYLVLPGPRPGRPDPRHQRQVQRHRAVPQDPGRRGGSDESAALPMPPRSTPTCATPSSVR